MILKLGFNTIRCLSGHPEARLVLVGQNAIWVGFE